MGYKATGKLYVIDETQQVSARFQKREFVLEIAENPRYPQLVQFQRTGDRVGAIDEFNVGDEVEVEFSLRGREWNSPRGDTKYFISLDVWTIQRAGAMAGAPAGRGGPAKQSGGGGGGSDDIPLPDEPNEEITDDIPF